MDLVGTVRKEGSRGGRGDFKWEDVKGSSHRENYLGHSVMAPVGRWQQGRDLSWYAKSGSDADVAAAADARKEEMRRVKLAEESAMSEALGLGPIVPPGTTNANETPLGKPNAIAASRSKAVEEDKDERRDKRRAERSRSRERHSDRRHGRRHEDRERRHHHHHHRRHDRQGSPHQSSRHDRDHGHESERDERWREHRHRRERSRSPRDRDRDRDRDRSSRHRS